MRQAACGDQEAFRQLWEAHHAIAQAAALRLCHQRTLAAEITQGAFLLAWRGLPRFRQDRPFRPWLMRILYRHALNVMEKQEIDRRPHSLTERSRTPRRRRWGEPSLIERIERVCGTGVEERRESLDARRVRRSKETERISK
jgi:DNA-directed RNA polymerase specialized sigma24 family protein